MLSKLETQLQALIGLHNENRLEELVREAGALLQQYPNVALIHNILGVANAGLGRGGLARLSFSKAIEIEPDNAELHNNLGTVQKSQRKFDEAAASYNRAIQLNPDFAEACNNLGNVLLEMEKPEDAIACFYHALKTRENYAEAYNNLGVAYKAIGDLEAAVKSYNKAIKIKPNFADAHNNLGNTFRSHEEFEKAITCYTQAVQIDPSHAEAHYNLGTAYKEIKKFDKGIECFARVIDLQPSFSEAYNSLGIILKNQGKFEEAIFNYKKALELEPGLVVAHHNMGEAFRRIGNFDEAIACFSRALAIKPDYATAQIEKIQQLAQTCDWSSLEKEKKSLIDVSESDYAISPFIMLALEDNPEGHRKRSEHYAAKHFKTSSMKRFAKHSRRSDRIRIGYFSGDFTDHPVGRLMARIFELHDRSKFTIHLYSNSATVDKEFAPRIKKEFDTFHSVNNLTDKELVQLVRDEEIDIAIDLSGYTKYSRTEIFSHRVAPIQINYLGYPGTTGAPFMDYIIADKIVIPPENQEHYSEKVIYLPNSYQAQDNTTHIPERSLSRKEFGLPEKAFVFCCFNNSYKITKTEFDIWMRLLEMVDGSVLWLFESNKWAKENLIKEAANRGIESNRLIFTRGTLHAGYLARLKLADLFLDTFNYNAGATASDALWSGLPVLTKRGASYTARMASSLLEAIELLELITTTEKAYEKLAFELATNPEMIQSLREKLLINRDRTPLFNTESFTENLEKAYQIVFERYLSGAEPGHVHVD